MVGWHHRLDGHGFGWTLGVGNGQGGLVCCGSWGCKESDTVSGQHGGLASCFSIKQVAGGYWKMYYNAVKFNKLGFMRDDTIHENDNVKEAIRRLPETLYNDRVFHIKRALDLSMRQQILPKEQWTKYEEDKF